MTVEFATTPTANNSSAAVNVSNPLRVAYLTSEYPKVSHTFIRREIVELERRGHHVLRVAIRHSGGAIADAADVHEAARTIHCLSQAKWRFAAAAVWATLTRPLRWMKALQTALTMHRRSERGLVTHLAYFAEAMLLLRLLLRERIDHVHVHFGTNCAAVARLIRLLGGPTYSMTIHGPVEFDAPYGFSLSEKVAEASFVIAISGFCAAQIRRWVPHSHWHKIHIVHCTVGDQFFETMPIPSDSNTLLCVGRLSAQKGQHLLVEAMQQLVQEGINARLVLAGNGEMYDEIDSHVAKLGLRDHIKVTGWIDEQTVRKLLLQSRALVQPSFAEGLPVVIMEAMAMARPVVSTMVAAIPELVKTRETGWLIAPGSLDELVNAMRNALCAPVDQLNEMGRTGQQLVRQRHFTSTEVNKLESIFEHYVQQAGAVCLNEPQHRQGPVLNRGETMPSRREEVAMLRTPGRSVRQERIVQQQGI